MAIHATALVYRESGVLIRGPSGSGKSSLALALLELARERRCFAGLIGDDRVLVRPISGRLAARCAANIEGLIERRGWGIIRTDKTVSALIRVVVDLLPRGDESPRVACSEERSVEIAGIVLPQVILGGGASSFERAYALIEDLDKRGCGSMGIIANFA